jgi:predicted nucleic acid-binding protein
VESGGARGVRASDRADRADRRGALALSRYCLDTSAYSHFKRGDTRVKTLIEEAEWLGVPTVVLGELWTGFLAGSNHERNEAELAEFVASPVVEEVPVDRHVARTYAEIVTDLRAAGTPLPTNDIWIAAASARAGAPLLTYDEHFRKIARIGTILLLAAPTS